MMLHSYDYEELIEARHSQIQHDIQVSQAEVHSGQQPALSQPKISRLDAKRQAQQRQSESLLRAS
jgi:hypothetical protein